MRSTLRQAFDDYAELLGLSDEETRTLLAAIGVALIGDAAQAVVRGEGADWQRDALEVVPLGAALVVRLVPLMRGDGQEAIRALYEEWVMGDE